MWNVSITNVEADIDGVARITYQYTHTDGRSETIVERISEPSTIKKTAADHVRELQRKDDITALIANPPLGDVDLTPPQLTDEQIAAQELNTKRLELRQLKEDVELGLADQATLDDAVVEAKTSLSTLSTISTVSLK